MRFVKMHGIGNDYVYVDAVSEPGIERRPAADLAALARRMSDRHTGVGSDGLILVCRPTTPKAHVRMRMWNADGSESEMCGNGVRCVAKFAHDRLGVRDRPMRVETGRGVLEIEYDVREGKLALATVDMGQPVMRAQDIPVNLPRPTATDWIVGFPLDKYVPLGSGSWIESGGVDLGMTCVSMGNPHLVLFCSELTEIPLETLGPFLERQPIFPNRINVHFAQVESAERAWMRTWERGAGLTRACGTGACAVCVAGVLTQRLARNVTLRLPGGELGVRWDEKTAHVFMTGPAEEVFEGDWPD